MADASGAFREALSAGDVHRVRQLWAAVRPSMPQPKDAAEAEVVMHRARTEAASVPLHKRLYSHAWLEERAMASGLPDKLRPDPVMSRIVAGVGVSVKSLSGRNSDRAAAIQAAMAMAAGEAMEDGDTDPKIVSARMWAARDRVLRSA